MRDYTSNSSSKIMPLKKNKQVGSPSNIEKKALLHHTTVGNLDSLAGFPRIRPDTLDSLDYIHPLRDIAEDNVLAVKPGSLGSAEEELRAVSVGPGISHGKDARPGVLQFKVFVFEFVPIDRLAPGPVPGGEVAALAHETGNDSMERTALEPKPLLTCTKSPKVFACLRHDSALERHDNLAGRRASDRHVKENVRRHGYRSLYTRV